MPTGQFLGIGTTRGLMALLAVCGVCAPAVGQEAPPPGEEPVSATDLPDTVARSRPPVRQQFGLGAADFSLSLDSRYGFGENYSGRDGELRVWRTSTELAAHVPFSARTRFLADFEVEYGNYRFIEPSGLSSADNDPFEDLLRYTLSTEVHVGMWDRWTAIVGAQGTSAGEARADFEDTLTYRLHAGAMYSVRPDFHVGVAAVALDRLEDDLTFFPWPIVVARIQFHDQWRLDIDTSDKVALNYMPTRDTRVELGAALSYWEYRLSDEVEAAEGAVKELRIPLDLTFHWNIQPHLGVHAGVGTDLGHSLEVVDSVGQRVGKLNLKPGVHLSAGLVFRF
jgi:hypothetical protein